MRQHEDMIRDTTDGDLTATETQTTTLSGTFREHPLMLNVLVPTDSGTDTLVVTLKCTTTGQKVEVTHSTAITGGTTTFPYTLRLPFPAMGSAAVAWSVVLTVVGSANFGEVQVWPELAEYGKVDVE